MQPRDEVGLNDRANNILHSIISAFISTGKPVGSRKIARTSPEKLSAATVRNIMADLEEWGFLSQPHTSAGRIPTDKAYRHYVDHMLDRPVISLQERALIDLNLHKADNSADQLMARTSQVLSQVSNGLGIVISPSIGGVALQHIQFMSLSDKRLLVILVSRAGIVQNRVIPIDEDYSQTDLDQAARYIVDNFKDKTLLEIRTQILKMIKREQARYDRLMQRVINLSTRTFAPDDGAQGDMYVDGASNLIKTPEFSDINKMRTLFETIEEKSRLASLIAECIEGDSQEVRIIIGAENPLPGIEDCTLITSRYTLDSRTHGSLGVLGPTRMEYGRAISLVDYVARIFGQVLGSQHS